jgi:tetratricopeptide (TPR) repeat protein/DNA-binding PadR family transcriptional regulator
MEHSKSFVSVEKRILLHLLNSQSTKHQYDVPIELTPNGIAEILGTNKTYIFTTIKKSLTKSYVKECVGWVKNKKKKQKYYILTDKGKVYSQKLKKDLSNQMVTIKLTKDTQKLMKIKNIIPYLNKENKFPDIDELDIYKSISQDGIIDIEQIYNRKKIQFIDHSAEAPRVLHFFGRKKETAQLNGWLEDKERNNIIFIHGMAGIGKTTLVAKLIESYRDSKHLFWHNFHKLDTLRGMLFKIAEFLSKIGHDHLEMYIRTRTQLDYYEVSRILKKSLGVIDAIFVFDDFHKSNDDIRSFFVYIHKMLISSSNTKIMIIGRKIIPFYDFKDLLTKKIVTELLLEGLDFESSKKLLSGKGIDKKRFKELYGFTGGNPLFLEILESKGHLERYIHDEMFSKLNEDERKILGILSIYRYPVSEDLLLRNDDFNFEKLYSLTEKSFVKKDSYDRYFVHDIIKQFFYSRLPPIKQKSYHLIAALGYEERDEPKDIIEAINQYQEAGKNKKASQLTIDSSIAVLEGGYATEFLNALERFDEKKVDTKNWAKILIVKGKACSMVGEWEKALLNFTQSSDISTILGDNELKVQAFWESGHILEEQNQLDKANDFFKMGLKISELNEYLKGIGECLRGIGRIHWRKSQYKKAITSYKKCLKISEKANDLELLASTYIDLGNVYDEKNNVKKAIECYNSSLTILNKIRNFSETARAYGNLAIMHRHMEEFDKSIEYGTKQLELTENLQNLKLMGYGYADIGYCYAKINDLANAKDHAKKAENIASKIDNENIMYQVNKTNALISKKNKKWDKAVKLLEKNIVFVEKLNYLYGLSDTHYELGLTYEEMGDEKNANKHFNIALKLNNKLDLKQTKQT